MIQNLLRKDDAKLAGSPGIFSDEEAKVIRKAVRGTDETFELRGKVFRIKRHRHKNEPWVNVAPIEGYIPMFVAPVNWVLDPEKEI
jgi:hypothetical protein